MFADVYIHTRNTVMGEIKRILNKVLTEVLKNYIPAMCTTVSPPEAAGFCEAVARDSLTAFTHGIMRQLSDQD